MTIMHFPKKGQTELVPIDVPDDLANYPDGGKAAARWANDNYLPYQDSGLEAAEKDPEHPLSGFPKWGARGLYHLAQASNVAQVQLGLDDPENAAKDIQDYENYLTKIPYSDEVGKSLLTMSEAKSVGEFWDAAATGPGIKAIGTIVGESVAQYSPAIAATIAAVAAGGGVLAAAAITALGSLAVEYGASTLSAMQDYLAENKQSINDNKAVAELFGNEEKMADFTEFGLKRGIPIAVIDAASMGIAGRLTHVLRKSRIAALATIAKMEKAAEKAAKKTKVKKKTPTGEAVTTTEIIPQIPKAPSKIPFRAALATEALVLQPGLGGLGEAVAQKVSGQEFKLGEVALEMIAEVPGGTLQTGLGLILQDAKDKKAAALKVKEEKKGDILRARKGNEEVAFVNSDLNEGAVNPETGELEAVQYETVAFNTLDTPVKAGERAFDREHIKNWFNGEIKQPRSKKLIIEYFLNKGYMEPVKGRKSQYQWTEAGEARNRQLNVESLEAAESEAEVVTLDPDVKAKIDEQLAVSGGIVDTRVQEVIDVVRASEEFGGPVADQAQAYADAQQEAAVQQRLIEAEADVSEPDVDTQIVSEDIEEEVPGFPVPRVEEVPAAPDIPPPTDIISDEELEIPGIAPEIAPPTDIVSPEELEIPGIAPEIAPPTAIPSAEELEVPGVAPEIAPPTAIPSAEELEVPELPMVGEAIEAELNNEEDLNYIEVTTPDGEEVTYTPRIPNESMEFVNETVAKYPKYIKDRIKPFKLRREGADRDLLRNEIDANIDMILTSQKIMTAVNRGKVSEEESEYLQKASLKDEEFINNIINESIVITNNADRQKQEEIVRQKIEKLSVQKIADDIFAMGLRIWHPVRMAEKYPAFRSFYQGVLMRREAREKYNNIGTLLAAPLYQDTSAKSVQTLSKVTALLDAFFSNRKSKSIFEIEGENQNLFIGRDRDGKITSLRLVIPEKAPLTEVTDKDPKTGEEVTIEVPVLDQVRYKTLLKGFKVEPGEKIDLSKDEVMKFNASQDAFKKMFDIHTMAFVKHMLQITPLHSGIELRHDDSVANIKAKILDSASRYIDELNKVLPEESRIPENVKASLKNARNDSTYLNDLIDLKKSLPRSKTDTNVYDNALGIFKTILNQNQMLININQQQRVLQEHPFYMPRLRYGEFFFTIQDTEQKDSSGKPKTIGYYTETPSARAITPKQKRQNLEKIREEVLEEYSDPRFIVTNIIARDTAESKTHLDITTLHEVERLGKSIGYDVQDKELKKFFDDVKDRLAEVGFGRFLSTRDPDVISGYYNSANRDNYLPTVLSNYIRSAADTASNLEFVRPLRQSIELLKDGDIKKGIDKQPKLGKMADDMLEHINKPNEPGALFKSFAFHYALGLNLSSAAVNATQVLVTTVPLLRMILGGMPGTSHAIAIKEVSKGWKDSVKLMKFTLKGPESRLASYGFNFDDPNPPKHLTRGEWNMLRRMYQRGTIQAIVNLDLGAKYQQQLGSVLKGKEVTNKFAKGLAAAQDGSAFMFGAVEQLNRITTALAAYRIAVKSNKNLSRFQKFSQVTMFSDEKMTPEEAARMMVYKTQFFIGKENRPQLFRSGVMNVATQFLSFVMQYIGLYTQALNMFLGKEGKVNGKWDMETWRMGSMMLGSLTLSMVFFSGLMGLPYMENIRQMLRYLTKRAGTYEFDLEYGMREAMSSFLNPTIVDHLVHGSASKILGMDIRRRVGVGEPIPYTLMMGDLLAISGPAGSLAFDAGRRFVTATNQGNIPMMVTATMPLGMRAFVEGGMGLVDPDKPVMTSRGRVMLPGKELSVGDRVKRMTGFTPGRVGLERKQKQWLQYIERAGKAVQDKILTKLAEKIYERSQEKSAAARRQLTQDIQEIRDEVLRQNRLYLKSGERHKLIRLTKRAIRDRIITLQHGQLKPDIYKQRKRLGPKDAAYKEIERMTGSLPHR